MITGLSLSTSTTVHVVFSLLAIFSGFIVVLGMIKAKRREGWTAFFLLMAGATSVTGFLFPSTQLRAARSSSASSHW